MPACAMGLPGFGKGRFSGSKCLGGSQQQAGTSTNSQLWSSLKGILCQSCGFGQWKILVQGWGSEQEWLTRQLSTRTQPSGPTAKTPRICADRWKMLGTWSAWSMWHVSLLLGCEGFGSSASQKLKFPMGLILVLSVLFCKGGEMKAASAVVDYEDLYKHAEGGKKSVACFPVRTYSCRS